MSGIPFYLCDVFTDVRFGGNQLAVVPRAEGLSDREMQQIAREFNFSETTFVFPARSGHTRRVRIFTPTREVPFAGHPNVGTAAMLAGHGELGDFGDSVAITFEEEAGLVPIVVERRSEGRFWCELAAPEPVSLGKTVPVAAVAAAASLGDSDIVVTTHQPQVASVGLPFLLAELPDRATLARARPNLPGLDRLASDGLDTSYLHLYARTSDGFDLRTRNFCSTDSLLEDPATGSANAALAGLLTHYHRSASGTFRWRIAQGVEMGRPSVLDGRAEKRDGRVVNVWIGGGCVGLADGVLLQ